MNVFVPYCNTKHRSACLLGSLNVNVPLPDRTGLLVAIFIQVISDPFHSGSYQ